MRQGRRTEEGCRGDGLTKETAPKKKKDEDGRGRRGALQPNETKALLRLTRWGGWPANESSLCLSRCVNKAAGKAPEPNNTLSLHTRHLYPKCLASPSPLPLPFLPFFLFPSIHIRPCLLAPGPDAHQSFYYHFHNQGSCSSPIPPSLPSPSLPPHSTITKDFFPGMSQDNARSYRIKALLRTPWFTSCDKSPDMDYQVISTYVCVSQISPFEICPDFIRSITFQFTQSDKIHIYPFERLVKGAV